MPLAVTLDGVDRRWTAYSLFRRVRPSGWGDKRARGQKLSLPARRHSGAGLFGQ